MKKIIEYLPFYLMLSICAGICIENNMDIQELSLQKSYLYIIIIIIFLYFIMNKIGHLLFMLIVILLFIGVGFLASFFNNPINYSNYYKKIPLENKILTLQIKEKLKHNSYYQRYIGTVVSVNNIKTRGNVLVNIKQKGSKSLEIGQLIYSNANFSTIKPPLTSSHFDYKSYLSKKYVFEQIYLDNNEFQILETKNNSIIRIAEILRARIEISLDKQPFSKEVLAVIKALLIGQRKDLSNKIKTAYSKAGVIHILAISGLHLGILLYFLNSILAFLTQFKYGNQIKFLIILVILWGFAFISGLSASITRSATMFSFVIIGKLLHKNTFTEYSIISSMLFLLLIKPMFLFHIGFQLSYLATFGIVWIYPVLQKQIHFNNAFFSKIWEILIISLSAQIAILPLSIYYFNSFSGLFLISNLVIIYFLSFVLILGIVIISLAVINILPYPITFLYNYIISQMNNFIEWISSFDYFIFKNLILNKFEILLCYLIIFGSINILYHFTKTRFFLIFYCFLTFQIVNIYEKRVIFLKNTLTVFHDNRNTIIGKQKGKDLIIYHSKEHKGLSYFADPIKQKTNVNINLSNKIPNIIQHKNHTLLVLKDTYFRSLKGVDKRTTILLCNSPKINLERILKKNNPKLIIADGSNYKSFIATWKKTCLKYKTPFYSTEQNGAYIFN